MARSGGKDRKVRPAAGFLDAAIGGVNLRIAAAPQAGAAMAFCRAYLGVFATGAGPPDMTLHIGAGRPEQGGIDALFADGKVLVTRAGSACLVFDTPSGNGWMRLDMGRRGGLQPLFRLLWLFVAQALCVRGAVLVHAAGIAINGRGYLFFGDSGAGKSTLARLGSPEAVYSDDSPVLFFQQGRPWIAAAPFDQRRFAPAPDPGPAPDPAPLAGLYFLRRDIPAGWTPVDPRYATLCIAWRHLHFRDDLPPPARRAVARRIGQAARDLPCAAFHYIPGRPVARELDCTGAGRDDERSTGGSQAAPALRAAPAL